MKLEHLPKIELHCHLDGSVPLSVFVDLAEKNVPGLPKDLLALRQAVEVSPQCQSLAQYLEKFALILSLLSDMDVLWQASYLLGEQLAAENVLYAELRFAPQALGTDAELALRTVVDALGTAQKDYGIRLQTILCMMRHMPKESNDAILDLAVRYQGQGVCAVDLAGDEAAYPNHLFVPLFEKAAALGLPYTIHSGECGSAQNVREAVELGARRIGHGIAALQDEDLCRLLAQEKVLLENCPISNLHTGAIASLQEYPIVELSKRGVPVCINTDNRRVSDTSLTREYGSLMQALPGVDLPFIKQCNLAAAQGAFLPQAERDALCAALETLYKPWLG